MLKMSMYTAFYHVSFQKIAKPFKGWAMSNQKLKILVKGVDIYWNNTKYYVRVCIYMFNVLFMYS